MKYICESCTTFKLFVHVTNLCGVMRAIVTVTVLILNKTKLLSFRLTHFTAAKLKLRRGDVFGQH